MFDANPRTASVLNRQFLQHIFRNLWDQVLVTSFKRDPANPDAPREDWNAWPAGSVLSNPHFDEGNTYFCPSLLKPGTRDRRLDNFKSLHAIVIDDVGTKVQLSEVAAMLGTQTYLIETSPGNYQAGWAIEPAIDLAWVKGMLTRLDQALGGRADNLTNPIAWRRLPRGFNSKAALVSPASPQGWEVRFLKRKPGPMIRGVDWPSIEPIIGTIERLTTTDRGIGNSKRPDDAVLRQDPVYQALEAGGYILGEKLTSDKFWAVTIKCPWISGHGPTRPLTGAEYVPAGPGTSGWFHCFHCEGRGQAEFRERLDETLREDHQKIVAAFDFDEIDPDQVRPILFTGGLSLTSEVIDLWSQKLAPEWPGNVFPAILEDTLAELAERGGLDLGALGAAMMTAASGAADKRARLTPYAGVGWTVPPVLWLMLVAEPGQRKTAILSHVLGQLRQLNATRVRQHARDMEMYRQLSLPQRKQTPAPIIQALLAEDLTLEKLQEWMADNARGLIYVRDELAGFLDFGRYSTGNGAAARASFLEFYEGGPITVARMTRTTHIDNAALSLIGGIQPQRLADFKGLTDDGLLSRFGTIIMPETEGAQPGTRPVDTRAIDVTIDRLLRLGGMPYGTDPAGEALIRDVEDLGQRLTKRPDTSVGYRGFLRKLHGTHARAALVLHMIDGGQDQIIPEDTVIRAENYTTFLLDHADFFYGEVNGGSIAEQHARTIGSYLLRHPKPRVMMGQLRRDACKCTVKEFQEAAYLLVIAGWLKPETPYPDNKAWLVHPNLENWFAARRDVETQRVDGVTVSMNQHGRFRPTRKQQTDVENTGK